MIRHRNGDADLRVLERRYQADPSDLSVYIAILAARRRAGIPVNRGVPPADVEAYALLLEAMIETAMTTRPRVVMAARLGHEAARLAAPEWAATRLATPEWVSESLRRIEVDWRLRYSRSESIGALGNHREIVSFACDCAERVLDIYEQTRPGDTRPRAAIEVARAWVKDPSDENVNAAFVASVAAGNASNEILAFLSAAERGGVYYATLATVRAADTVSGSDYLNSAADAASDACFARHFDIMQHGHADRRYVDEQAVLAESLWQQQRLAKYLVGEVSLPSSIN